MFSYPQVYNALIKAKKLYAYEQTQPSKRYTHRNKRLGNLERLAEILAQKFKNRRGLLATDEVEITASPKDIATAVGVSVPTLKSSYMGSLSIATGFRYVFKG